MNKVEDNQENLSNCACPGCPSFDECMRGGGEGLYCAKGKSSCDFKKMGCICGGCPVHKKSNLTSGYYCEVGAEEE